MALGFLGDEAVRGPFGGRGPDILSGVLLLDSPPTGWVPLLPSAMGSPTVPLQLLRSPLWPLSTR